MLNNYTRLPNGVIKQVNIKELRSYDVEYVVNSYNTYGEKGMQMSYLRLGYLIGSIGVKKLKNWMPKQSIQDM
jgi:hypothetical protein